jgi:DNA-binding NarL/FixJ family response regulator
MTFRAVVVDPLPLYRQGVTACLSDLGCAVEVDVPPDLATWQADGERHVVVISLCSPAEWQLLAELHATRPNLLLLAMVDTRDAGAYVTAIRQGATSAIPRTCSPHDLKVFFTALINGTATLPVEAMRSLVASADPDELHLKGHPSDREVAWLRQLAQGRTVAQLADSCGYSERMMFRRLREVYDKLDAQTRTQALMSARDHGWL